MKRFGLSQNMHRFGRSGRRKESGQPANPGIIENNRVCMIMCTKCITSIVIIHLLHCVSKNDTALACYNFDLHQPILIIFGRNVTETASSQTVLYFSTSPK